MTHAWTHYRLLTKVENERARQFYLTETIETRWSTRQLERQINSFYYERMLSSRERLDLRADENQVAAKLQPADIIKDPSRRKNWPANCAANWKPSKSSMGEI